MRNRWKLQPKPNQKRSRKKRKRRLLFLNNSGIFFLSAAACLQVICTIQFLAKLFRHIRAKWGCVDFFCEQIFIFIKKYMLQYFNTSYYPLPPRTDGQDLQSFYTHGECNHVRSSRGLYPQYIYFSKEKLYLIKYCTAVRTLSITLVTFSQLNLRQKHVSEAATVEGKKVVSETIKILLFNFKSENRKCEI